jgi:DNA-binding LacI/PurR family transcriptional regulator
VPTVVVTQKAESLPYVCVSHQSGGRQVAEHFKELGCSSCLLIGTENDAKFIGFKTYIQSQHVKNFRITHLEIREWSENIIDQVQKILTSRFDATSIRQFDCIFAINDLAAIGSLHALSEWNCRVPEEMAVCGFDDIPIAKEVRPRLTSVAQPISQIANSGFELLRDLITHKKITENETKITLKPHIVIRESTLGTSTAPDPSLS